MSRPLDGERPAPFDLDPGLRVTAENSIARWQRRLAQPDVSAHEVALVAREATQLRGLAAARGAGALAERLALVERLAVGRTPALVDAVNDAARLIGMGAGPSVARRASAGEDAPGGAVAPKAAPSDPPPAPAAAEPPSIALAPSIALPPLLGLSVIRPPLAEPAPLGGTAAGLPPPIHDPPGGLAPRPSAAAPLLRTMLSGAAPDAPDEPSAPERVAPAGAAAAVRLPDSVAAPRQPHLLAETFLGFRAFGRKSRPLDPAPPRPAAGAGPLLGLEQRRARSNAAPLPAAEMPARRRPIGLRTEPAQKREKPGRGADLRPRTAAAPAWFYWVSGAMAALATSTVVVIVRSGHRPGADPTHAPAPASSAEGRSVGTAPVVPAGSGGGAPGPASAEGVELMTADAHQRGTETPELRALIDTQSRLAVRCRSDPTSCGRGWTPLSVDALSLVDRASLASAPASGPLSAWLTRLKLPPDFPVHDDPVLRSSFDFDAKNIAGRQRFQAELFDCAAYADIFDSTLVKYGAPTWLTAVVYQESGCNPRATSDVGARGLWQFMPESARAYGLRVDEGNIDERLNPIKATDAAIHFLTDLYRKLGAWDLVLAAYNAGPFAILARLAQAGPNVGFWQLAHAGLLPEETAGYVPAIEAYALLLENLSRLEFTRDGKRLEATAEVIVKPGTRLSLLARAASTTTLHIRELNPEFLRDVVPEGETAARVPDAEVHRAQAFLDGWSPDDDRDTCVPEDFDWGAKEFETSKFARTCAHGARTP